MATVYDVAADNLIEELSKKLKSEFKGISPPSWAMFTKTASYKQRAPFNQDWWFVRCASILRKIYVKGPVGISRMETIYGGRKNRGRKPESFRKGSGSIIRNAFKQLQDAGLIEKAESGRKISPKGRSLVDKTAYEIHKITYKSTKKSSVKKEAKKTVKKETTKQ